MMKLKTVDWTINANGSTGILRIKQLDAAGRITGASKVFDDPLVGVWDDDARRITFLRVTVPNDPSSIQLFTGCLLDGENVLAGTFIAFAGTGGKPERHEFGWFARVQPVV